ETRGDTRPRSGTTIIANGRKPCRRATGTRSQETRTMTDNPRIERSCSEESMRTGIRSEFRNPRAGAPVRTLISRRNVLHGAGGLNLTGSRSGREYAAQPGAGVRATVVSVAIV